jgi:hypothetical protein
MKQSNPIYVTALIAGLAFSYACKPRQEQDASLKDLNEGKPLNSDGDKSLEAMKKDRKVVVIYYANDTFAPRVTDPAHANLNALTRFLELEAMKEANKDIKEPLLNLSKKLLNDWDEFNRVVKQNVNILTSRLCSSVGTNYAESVAGLAVFRNSSAEVDEAGSGRYMWDAMWHYCKIGDRVLRSDYLRIPSFKEFPYSSQPFANADTLELALEQVKRVFNPQDHRFILITKSHGSKENAIVPHFSVDLRERIKDEPQVVLEAIKKGMSNFVGLDMWKTDTLLDSVDDALKNNLSNTQEKGVAKIEYLRILNKLGQVSRSDGNEQESSMQILKDGPMMFPVVLMESCKSDLRYSQQAEIQKALSYYGPSKEGYMGFNMRNVGKLYTSSDKGLGYNEIDYSLLQGFMANNATDFQDLFSQILDDLAKKGK